MKFKQLLSPFNLREIEIVIYEKLFFTGEMSASQLAKETGITRTSVYDLLEKLIKAGLVTQSLKGGIKVFIVTSPKKLEFLVEEKAKEISAIKQDIKELELIYKNKSISKKPKLQIFEGKKELEQMMNDILLYRDITVLAYWPVKKVFDLLGKEFVSQFQKKRAERNIKLRVIWPKNQSLAVKQFPFFATTSEWKREVRVAPDNIDFALGYTIYSNTVRFISSSRENFGFLVESPELVEMMEQQFEVIWKLAKPL